MTFFATSPSLRSFAASTTSDGRSVSSVFFVVKVPFDADQEESTSLARALISALAGSSAEVIFSIRIRALAFFTAFLSSTSLSDEVLSSEALLVSADASPLSAAFSFSIST